MMDVQMKCVHGVDMGMNCGNCGNSFRLLEVPGKSVLVSLDQEFLKAAQALTASASVLTSAVEALNATVKDMNEPQGIPALDASKEKSMFMEVKRGPITSSEWMKFCAVLDDSSTGIYAYTFDKLRETLEEFAKSRGLL